MPNPSYWPAIVGDRMFAARLACYSGATITGLLA